MELSLNTAARSVMLLHGEKGGKKYLGTGFLVQLPGALCLLTAEHVTRDIGDNPQITFGAADDAAQTFDLKSILRDKPLIWTSHGIADVAALVLDQASRVPNLAERALNSLHFVGALEAPQRERPLTVVGFPLGLGGLVLGPDKRISPISRESRAASGLITLPRFDTKVPTEFFLLDNPSIGGFSGAPVFQLPSAFSQDGKLVFPSPDGICTGLVHGTIGDDTGGKLAAVVPSALIAQTMSKAYTALQR